MNLLQDVIGKIRKIRTAAAAALLRHRLGFQEGSQPSYARNKCSTKEGISAYGKLLILGESPTWTQETNTVADE